jgi:hypothetical protein
VAFFALTEVCGPAWDPSRARREQDGWYEHAAFMDGLVEDGFVILGGPVGNGDRVLLLVEAEDEQEIERRLAADPWLPGVLRIESIEPWALWLGAPRAVSGAT